MGRQLIAAGGGEAAQALPPISAVRDFPYWERPDDYWGRALWAHPPVFFPRFTEVVDTDPVTGAEIWNIETDVLDPDGPDGAKAWRTCLRSPSVHRYLAVLDGLHHANTKQLVAWTGNAVHKRSHYHLGPAFDLGLLERGRYAAGHKHRGKQTYLWKPHDGKPMQRFVARLAERDPDTARRLFGSRPPRHHAGGPHTRHDVLTVEALLRLMETQPRWVAISPEHHTSPAAVSGDQTAPADYSGDAVLWRDDGLRVVVEVCASRNIGHHAAKMEKWASWLGGRDPRETGIVVVFLNAHADKHRSLARLLRKAHGDVIAPGRLRHHSGQRPHMGETEVQKARSSIVLASWEDWFPPHHAISEEGVNVACAATRDGRSWVRVDLADADSYRYRPTVQPAKPHDWLISPRWLGDVPMTTPKVA